MHLFNNKHPKTVWTPHHTCINFFLPIKRIGINSFENLVASVVETFKQVRNIFIYFLTLLGVYKKIMKIKVFTFEY